MGAFTEGSTWDLGKVVWRIRSFGSSNLYFVFLLLKVH